MRELLAILSVCVTLCTSACRHEAAEGEHEHLYANHLRTDALGCYRLELKPGIDSEGRGEFRQRLSTLRLGQELNTRYPYGFRRVSGWQRLPQDSLEYWTESGWIADSLTDSIRVSVDDMYHGYGLTLTPANGGWEGSARYFSDGDPPRVHHDLGQVHARPVSCAETTLVAPAG